MNYPLIIESPGRQGKVRRIVQGIMTLTLWLLWFYLLLPVFEPALALAGVDLSDMDTATKTVNTETLTQALLLVSIVMLVFWLWVRYNTLLHRFRTNEPDQCNTVGHKELADSFDICPLALTDWHRSGQLVIRLTEQGDICSVEAGELKTCQFPKAHPATGPLPQGDIPSVSKAS